MGGPALLAQMLRTGPMKISRNYPPRRRNPLTTILAIVAVVLLAVLIFAWIRGGPQPMKPVEKPIAADRLGQ